MNQPAHASEHALSVNGLRKRFGAHVALNGVSFQVPTGSVFGLLGPNGAGKTTLFSIVAGFVRADAGSVSVMGMPHRDAQVLRGVLGVLPQDAAFQSDISILDQLVYFLRLAGRSLPRARREVCEALDKVGLSDWLGRRSTELSHGMYKRLCLAQAFLGDPQVVLLDEPTAGLDPANADTIRNLIRDQAKRRAAVVVSSHDMAEMQALCSHVAILKKGTLVSCGPLQDMTARRGLVRLRLLSTTPELLASLAALPGVATARPQRDGLIDLELDGTLDEMRIAVQRHCLEHRCAITAWDEGQTLERHFLEVTRAPAKPAESTNK